MRIQLSNGCKALCVLLAFALTPGPASAFDTLASDFAFSNLQRKLLDRRTGQQQPRDVNSTDALAAVRFVSDPARTQANLQSFVDQTPEPQAKADLKRLIEVQPSIIDDIGKAMQTRYDLDANNFADVYAAWWITAWQVSEKEVQDPDRKTANAVSEQVHAALLDTPEFLNMGDAERQQTAEGLLLQALLMSEAALATRNDPDMQDQIAETVTRSARQNGVELTSVQLTSDGFVLR